MATVANLKLLVEVLAHVELDPDSWNQGCWLGGPGKLVLTEKLPEQYKYEGELSLPNDELESLLGVSCETAACIAGWACLLSGAAPRWNGYFYTEEEETFLEMNGEWVDFNGEPRQPAELAMELLEIESQTDDFGSDLFSAQNGKEEVYEIAANIFRVTPDDLEILVDKHVRELEGNQSRWRAKAAAEMKTEISTG